MIKENQRDNNKHKIKLELRAGITGYTNLLRHEQETCKHEHDTKSNRVIFFSNMNTNLCITG